MAPTKVVVLPRLADTLPVEPPDASDWTIQDVVNYFTGVGFVEQADVFREQVSWVKLILSSFTYIFA